ncbi:unnamed protein product [Adineta steineri]|uniref:Apple domain-containing protein n=3 Tax=Adineta steineri TaxID=433720 RepID=A0A814IBZ0_9BILA|nr:unnamed protein product [Adineta steineri]CAF3649115.1 unnamed protein product [Adineta steineri]
MSLLISIILISIILSNCNVEASRTRSKIEKEKYLRQLIRQLQWNEYKRSYYYYHTRTEAEGDCSADFIGDYRWYGEEAMSIPSIDTTQRCMDSCDIESKCMGWTYYPDSKWCMGFNSITGLYSTPGTKSGSCIGTSIKSKCSEKRDGGQYTGVNLKKLETVSSAEDCMTACDNLNTCYGWLYTIQSQTCDLLDNAGTFYPGEGFITGSCIAPQKRVRLAEPLKIFRKEALERHNDVRKKHCAPDLTLDSDLNKLSQDLATKLAAEDNMPPIYQETGLQTVYYDIADAARHCTSIVDCFYDERNYYDWNSPDFSATNRFPKVIWKGSQKLGVGRAFSTDTNTMYIVITYDWQGDWTQSYKENVLPVCT